MTYLDEIALEEAFLNQIREPLRRRYQRHPLGWHARENATLVLKVVRTVDLANGMWIRIELRTPLEMRTMRLPL